MMQEGGARKHSRAEQEYGICPRIHSIPLWKGYVHDL